MIFEYQGKKPVIGHNVFVAPTATVIGDVVIEDGVSIWFGAVIRADLASITIGASSNIQDNCTLHVDVDTPLRIGRGVTVGHNAVIHGCTLEDRCLIGMNAVVLNRARVRTGSIVAAGAVVREGQTIGPDHLVAGSPAVFKKDVAGVSQARIAAALEDYLMLSRRYLHKK